MTIQTCLQFVMDWFHKCDDKYESGIQRQQSSDKNKVNNWCCRYVRTPATMHPVELIRLPMSKNRPNLAAALL